MKLADIKVGERYVARVSGRLVPVRITEIRDVCISGRNATRIEAVNEATNRPITIKSAQRLRSVAPASRPGPTWNPAPRY